MIAAAKERHDPLLIRWNIVCGDADDAQRVAEELVRICRPACEIRDHAASFAGGQSKQRTEMHRIGDYFSNVSVVPHNSGNTTTWQLTFIREPAAGPFWKDVMGDVLQAVKTAGKEVSITLERRSDRVGDNGSELHQRRCPRPLRDSISHLSSGSREFWRIAAIYSLAHESFTFTELADTSGIDKESLKARYRNSLRALPAKQKKRLLRVHWDDERKCNVYSIPDGVRDDILRCLAS